MDKTTRKQFEQIEQDFVKELTSVRCSTEDYIEAMETIIGNLEIAKDAAQQDLKMQRGD